MPMDKRAQRLATDQGYAKSEAAGPNAPKYYSPAPAPAGFQQPNLWRTLGNIGKPGSFGSLGMPGSLPGFGPAQQPAMPSSAPAIGSGAVPPAPQAPASPFSPNAVPPPVPPATAPTPFGQNLPGYGQAGFLNPPTNVAPANQGIFNAAQGMRDQNQAIAARPQMAPYAQRAVDAVQPTWNRQAIGLNGQPIGNVEDLIAKDKGIARQGNYRESMLADMNRRPSSGGVGLAPPKQFPETDFKPTGNFKPSLTSQAAKDAAKATFDARRGGTAQRQADYQARTTKNTADRKAGVKAEAVTRSEARREAMGRITPAEVLERMNPLAAAQKGVAQTQIESNAQTRESDRLFRGDQADKDRASRQEIAKTNAIGNAAAHNMPSPFSPPVTPPAKAEDIPGPGELSGLAPAEQKERVAHLPPATQERVLTQANRKGFWSRMFGSIDQPKQSPVANAVSPWLTNNPFSRAQIATMNTPELIGPSAKARKILATEKARKAKTPAGASGK